MVPDHSWGLSESFPGILLLAAGIKTVLWGSGAGRRVNWELLEVTEDENINSRQGYFLGGPVVRNPLAIAGDMDSPPDRERSHMLWDN